MFGTNDSEVFVPGLLMGLEERFATDEAQSESPPPVSEEDAQELQAAIQKATEYGSMLALPAWKDLNAQMEAMYQDAVKDLLDLTDMNEVYRCQMVIKTIGGIRNYIDGVFKMAQGAQSHKAQP